MTDLILPEQIKAEVRKLMLKKQEDIEWTLADAMACKTLYDWRNICKHTVRDTINMIDIDFWYYFDCPFMACKTWMDRIVGQLKYEIRRIDDVKTLVTQSTERKSH